LARIVRKLLAVDRAVFGHPNVDAPILVDFPDGVSESMLKLSQTVLALFQGENASRLERQKILHPDWNDDMWAAEVARLEKEFPAVEPITNPDDVSPTPPPPASSGGGDGPVGETGM
jgi:hypothetical protein